jgi:hypothetical protein
MTMTIKLLLAALGIVACTAAEEQVSASSLMARVAANQERSVGARAQWTYKQELLVRMNRKNGKMAREEFREYAVMPDDKGTKREMVRFEGKYERDGKVLSYSSPHFEYKDLDIDGDVVSDLAEDMMTDKNSRDGIDKSLFPLTGQEQTKFNFKIAGRETFKDREVWRVTFEPKEEGTWAGEALIDVEQAQPVLVTTRFGKNIPLLVKTLLGTDLQYAGFKVEYKELEPGVWFPVRYGGEFYVRAVFFYKRKVGMTLSNSEFRRADVNSSIEYLAER